MKKRKGMRTGYTRKIFHSLIFVTVSVIHWQWGTSIVCLFGGMVTLVVFYAVYMGPGDLLYEALAREKDEPHRSYYVIVPYIATLTGGLVSNIMFGGVAVFGYLVTGIGDAVGEPAGVRWGKHKYRVPALGGVAAVRSYEGSLAVFIASGFALFIGSLLTPAVSLTIVNIVWIVAIAFICMGMEAVSPHGWDNATLQIVPSFLVTLIVAGGV